MPCPFRLKCPFPLPFTHYIHGACVLSIIFCTSCAYYYFYTLAAGAIKKGLSAFGLPLSYACLLFIFQKSNMLFSGLSFSIAFLSLISSRLANFSALFRIVCAACNLTAGGVFLSCIKSVIASIAADNF